MELMNAVLYYFYQPEAQQAVLLPGLLTIYAMFHVREDERKPLFFMVVLSTIASYSCARWEVTDEYRQLFIIPCAFFCLAGLMWANVPISATSAYAMTFLSMWSVDMSMAMHLVYMKEETWLSFFYGVGGAGYWDGLSVIPLASAALVQYAGWRRPKEAVQQTPVLQLA